MKWKDIWKEEPPRDQQIFFMTGNREVHIGGIFSEEKSVFYSIWRGEDYYCEGRYEDRVMWWFPIPEEVEDVLQPVSV